MIPFIPLHIEPEYTQIHTCQQRAAVARKESERRRDQERDRRKETEGEQVST